MNFSDIDKTHIKLIKSYFSVCTWTCNDFSVWQQTISKDIKREEMTPAHKRHKQLAVCITVWMNDDWTQQGLSVSCQVLTVHFHNEKSLNYLHSVTTNDIHHNCISMPCPLSCNQASVGHSKCLQVLLEKNFYCLTDSITYFTHLEELRKFKLSKKITLSVSNTSGITVI